MRTYTHLPIAIPSLFDEIVSVLADNLYTELGNKNVRFKHGTWLELMKELVIEQNGNLTTKLSMYPLICLIHDFEEKYTDKGNIEVSLDFVILTPSLATKTPAQRYADNYIPKLYPIYAEFMQLIKDSSYFIGQFGGYNTHSKIDALHMGQTDNNGNIAYKLPEILDGIIIKGLDLTIDKAQCQHNNNLLLK